MSAVTRRLRLGPLPKTDTVKLTFSRIPIQVDVGFGDAITPGPIEIDTDRRCGRGLALEAAHRVDSGNTESVSFTTALLQDSGT